LYPVHLPERAMRVLKIVLPSLLLVPAAFAQGEDNTKKIALKATKVAGQVYVIEDASPEFSGGNIGASVGPDGLVLVDDKFTRIAPKVEAALKGISNQPVRFVLNTHFHGDHMGGNIYWGKKATIIAHENTRKRLLEDKEPVPPSALPIITFEDKVKVHLNGEDIRAIHFPAGHTDTDVVVFFTKSNVVHLGDDFFNGIFPFIDIDSGGSVKGLIANLEMLLKEIPPDAKIIPGHGPLATVPDLAKHLDMLKGTAAIVEAGIRDGKTAEQLKKEKALEAYDAWSKGFMSTDNYIDQLYKDLSKK
jgi:glyoxylase-like metal-dependent hydrolase (beta-lactamase superfamily II)